MKVMVIGSGGREHALVWKLAQSKKVERIHAAPGNGGTAAEKKCENVDLLGRDICEEEVQEALIRYMVKESIDLAIVGPEAPLAAGIVNRFRAAGQNIIGPDSAGAALEASKAYAKSFMEKYGIRAASSLTFTECAGALEAVRAHFDSPKGVTPPPLVIKADGLAAGKGVVICSNAAEAGKTVRAFMEDGALDGAGKTLILEEFLEGREVSVLAAVSAAPSMEGVILPFAAARDHKRRFDHDRGPNTGGMGAIAPVYDFTKAAQSDFIDAILAPTLKGMRAEGFDYRGFIFFGLMIRNNECKLLEYNVRLGDPETQAVLPLLENDFAELCSAILDGSLSQYRLAWKPGAVCAPVAVAGGYPGEYRKGDAIAFNETAFKKTGALFFAAGAVRSPGGAAGSGLRTSGGRVLSVSAYGADSAEARDKAYAALNAVNFSGMSYRRDIGET
ncbi:MAG: phosphoribosylamine--glycine ligase [Treponema sp.]|jgi:phosphoribosylamine--glycine ligase|nr:phosphoribosylamine--glycine ligase [Treponema sp.]